MSSKLTHYFESLTHGNIYHILVSVIDRAGNESDVRCSPYTEVDLYAPSLVITDPSSNPGFVRDDDGEVLVEIGNDLDDGFWCITNDLDFNPPESQDPTSLVSCPGGFGPSDGWLTESPSELTLPTDEGQQDYCLWLVRTDGSLVSNNNVCVSLIYDNTPPDAFNILGVHGDTDETIDAWLTSHTLIVDWAPSSGLNHYNLSLEDNTSQELCRIDEIPADHVRFDMTADCPELANGETYYLKMQAVDEANNRTDAPDFPFTVDRTPPGDFLITGVRGGDDMTIDAILGTSAPEVFFTPSSGAHTGRIEIQDMAGSTVCPSSEFSISGDSYTHAGCSPLTHASTYRILMSTFDQGRNQTLAENTPFTFLVDQEPPEIVFTSQPESITQDTSATIHFTVVDDLTDVDSIECSENSGAWSDCTSPQSLTSLPDGMHELGVRSRDIAGNLNQESVSWIVDTTPPVLTLSSVPTNYVNTTAQSMTFSATDENDIDYYECALNGASWAGCSSPFNMTAVVGTNIAAVRAFDPAGNHHELTTSFLVDVEPPVLAFTDTPDVITASSDATFIWSASDPGDSGIDTVECSLNAGAWAACSSPHSLTGLAEQAHNFRVRATDRAGNTSDPISYDWDVYQSGPALSFDLTPSSLNNLTSVDFEYSGTVPSGVTVTGYECNLNAGGWTSCGSPQSFSGLTEQTQELQVRGLDSLGNTGNPIAYSWVTDLTAPVVTLSSPGDYSNETSQTFTFSATDTGGADEVAGFECSLDGASFASCSSPMNLSGLSDGGREFQVRATDTVGNTSSPVTASWLIDLEPPTVSITSGPTGTTHNETSFNFTFNHGDTGGSGVASVQCRLNSGSWSTCSSPHTVNTAAGSHTFTVRVTDGAGNQTTDSQSWLSYTYSWNTTSWSSCSANPTWSGWSSCSASPYWGSWGSCSASCGGGTQTRTCFGTSGTRTRSCSGTSGTQTRTVTCLRNDGVAVSDSYCTASKPTESQACTQSCSGSSTQSCTQSCSGSSSQSCNTHSCGLSSGSIVPGSSICTANPGFFCSGTVTGSSVGCDASLCASNSATRECTATPCTTVHGDPGTSSRCRCN